MLSRRHLLGASAATMALPSIVRAESSQTLKFIPQSDLTVLDPIVTTVYTARNHGYLVFDTLFGLDSSYQVQPQMLAGYTVDADKLVWTLTLREGLRFHDGQTVLARDCVASIRRWSARDALGNAMLAATNELTATDDRTIMFRLKKPFPLLPYALGKISTPMCAMMPERLAQTDPFKQITEMVGSGPYRFLADERVSGARAAYRRFEGYQPRNEMAKGWTAGGKITHFERVEWITIPDVGTAAAALQSGEVDWWEQPTDDLVPALLRAGRAQVDIKDRNGILGLMKMNTKQPPFDNPAIRRALLGAVVQSDYMTAIAGTDPKMWRAGVGLFCPGSELETDVGMEVLNGPRDLDRVRADIRSAGYNNETVALLGPTDIHFRQAMAEVGHEMLRSCGFKVDYQAMDWGTAVVRRESKAPVDKGGWNVVFTTLAGLDVHTPTNHAFRTTGDTGWFGWSDSPRIETLRNAWMDAPDPSARKRIASDIQRQWWIDVPHIPVGQWFQPTGYRADIDGMLDGFPIFWGVRRAA